ncbi:conserved hypothetical protein [Candidatus Nitrotoga sp. HW29]|uniref:hypothetical protein n=1 Tax=Candidatus Nitrotoga sp. HW29 TaxID=2886963 RepID=UPI001EF2357E|nr:hypothetical protein [Candidatus Nitrotoga sp. HW29]CAH1904167.1 conserved hypothetical protein [Candidatus Nitrotoga sp. HW29]
MASNAKSFAAILVFICGCTTVSSFQKMPSYERAQYVCSRDSNYKRLSNDESIHEAKIDEINSVLSRGYRVHKACKTVKVEKPGTVSCTSNSVGNAVNTDCKQNTKTTYENVCTETPVAIDASLERENLEASKNMVVRAKIEKNNVYNRCYSLVEPMSAEQAFNYYEKK